ncbi:MAG TPA: CpsD/CapB family tyrosine-protein kinase, partial [Firmicutes bacterium]|nr:CpsD/CapB family tyrosine-protein kinase [Bacillota bacterium]
ASVTEIVDGFVFVISSGSTDKRAASNAIDMLENAKANIIGAVLNRAEPGKSYGSYYAHYYYSYYTNDDD